MEVVADTHTLIWYLTGSNRLGSKAKQFLDEASSGKNRLIIPIVVLMETMVLVEKRKVNFAWDEFLKQVTAFPDVLVYPVGIDVLEQMRSLDPKLELHDRVVVATTMLHNAVLLTRDRTITEAKIIKIIW